MYEATTRNIRVLAEPFFVDSESRPEEHHFFWAYRIVVENQGDETVQLISRYWHITDARGNVEEVRGPGVVGDQPTISPGESFSYESGCPLSTPSGIMRGHYNFQREDEQDKFMVAIPAFSLDSDYEHGSVN
ncbi:MAG: Co2+/Mg2+ efflux protein ApaG [Alphaproteobacteria bacterium]|nr:Co2+/Mg2+ efflux protein ApaG [Alphaproteobacteria bacterium]